MHDVPRRVNSTAALANRLSPFWEFTVLDFSLEGGSHGRQLRLWHWPLLILGMNCNNVRNCATLARYDTTCTVVGIPQEAGGAPEQYDRLIEGTTLIHASL